MNMTNEEILVSFKQSAKPLQQVRILADLNGTDQETIRQILEKQGVDPAVLHRNPRVQKKNTPPPEPSILDRLAEEEGSLVIRQQNIRGMLPVLQRELEGIDVKLEAVQKARFALAEVYQEVEHESK